MGCTFVQQELMKLVFEKPCACLMQSQNNTFLKEFCPGKELELA